MVKRRRVALGALALCGACSVAPPIRAPRPVMVNIPVALPVYCDAPELEKPTLPVATLEPDSPPTDTVRIYAATVEVLKGAVTERDRIIDGCRRPRAERYP
jgi:hypothetical protein